MFIRSSDQIPRVTLLKRFPVPSRLFRTCRRRHLRHPLHRFWRL